MPDTFAVRKGERIRLRLINAANARIFSPDFTGFRPAVIALDGQPVTPHAPEAGGAGSRNAHRSDPRHDGQAGQPAFDLRPVLRGAGI
ncbi:hypothetical protein [Mesorhizobium sp.]|uniref:hypothetical protein n=1 Tax=Mesorhizobium sp. TaxID=1871066 RepID=UPI0025D21E7E|nr:hypothetical protein [Mesorhizobium sp.]